MYYVGVRTEGLQCCLVFGSHVNGIDTTCEIEDIKQIYRSIDILTRSSLLLMLIIIRQVPVIARDHPPTI